ncbi:MAG: transglutaminase N-terminal domain-containing protein [Lautropia sp.]
MKLSVHHATSYRYAAPVARSTQYIRLTPCDSVRQKVLDWQLELPAPGIEMTDTFGNLTHLLTLSTPHDAIAIRAAGTVEVAEADDGEPAGPLDPRVFLRETALTEADAAILALCDPLRRLVATRPLIGVSDLVALIVERIGWRADATDADTSAAQVLGRGAGVGQDRVHLLLACCRALGLPARYVSGYGYTQDLGTVASRAWAEVWLSHRWVSFQVGDSTAPDGGLIKLAVGLDHRDASPVRGVRLGGGEERLSAHAQVQRTEA